MICIFLISGSTFHRKITYNTQWINYLKSKNNVYIKNIDILDFKHIVDSFLEFKKKCKKEFINPIIVIFGISSGGYYGAKLNNFFNSNFCILISPILDPIYRKKYIIKTNIRKYKKEQILKYTPKNIRKINLKIKDNTLVIVGKKDSKAPIDMYKRYKIKHLKVLTNYGHSITKIPNKTIKQVIDKFLVKLTIAR